MVSKIQFKKHVNGCEKALPHHTEKLTLSSHSKTWWQPIQCSGHHLSAEIHASWQNRSKIPRNFCSLEHYIAALSRQDNKTFYWKQTRTANKEKTLVQRQPLHKKLASISMKEQFSKEQCKSQKVILQESVCGFSWHLTCCWLHCFRRVLTASNGLSSFSSTCRLLSAIETGKFEGVAIIPGLSIILTALEMCTSCMHLQGQIKISSKDKPTKIKTYILDILKLRVGLNVDSMVFVRSYKLITLQK